VFYNRINNPILRGVAEWLVSFGIAILLFFVMREFIFRTARVDGNSMAPTLEHGDMVILNRFAYVFGSPQVGDIVAFPYAGNTDDHYIKRIIAASGDIVDFRDGVFFVNDLLLEDDFSDELIFLMGDTSFPIEIEDGRFFVLGDNRNGSRDSRFTGVGNVPAEGMIGRATVRFWPLGRLGNVRN
jgi:signal peptidase I